MENIPLASPSEFISGLSIQKNCDELWYIFHGNKGLMLLNQEGTIPTHALTLKRSLFLGTYKEKNLFAAEMENQDLIPPGWSWNSLRSLFGVISEENFALAGRALQMIEWDRTHQYCGCCGHLTFVRTKERCRECVACGHLAFPKIAPAILALVKKENKILLARNANFPEKFYSVLAGFVDPGETLEQCVEREIFEEVGLTVKNISYFGSQPWPFSHSLMIGFTCEWHSGTIRIDASELIDANWFDRTHLPQLPPALSLSRLIIDAHLASQELRKIL